MMTEMTGRLTAIALLTEQIERKKASVTRDEALLAFLLNFKDELPKDVDAALWEALCGYRRDTGLLREEAR